MIVLDASAAIELLRRSPVGSTIADLLMSDEGLHVPHLLDVEVAQALRRLTTAGELSPARATLALEDLGDLDAERHSHEHLLPRVWELRENLTAYDAVYVALTETLDATLVTLDRGLANSPSHRANVRLLIS